MSTLISLTNLSRFLEDCKSFFSRKPVRRDRFDDLSVPKVKISNNTSYIISVFDDSTDMSETVLVQMCNDLLSATHLHGGNVTKLKWDASDEYLYVYSINTQYGEFCSVIINKIDGNRVIFDTVELTSTTGSDVTIKKFQSTSDKVTSLSASSTNTQYPSAKCVYDFINRSETSITNADPFYTRRCTSVGFKGNGMITNIKGNSTIWNQVFEITGGNTSASSNGITYSRSGNVITLSGTASAAVTFGNIFEYNFEKKDHKYIVRNNKPSGVNLSINLYNGIAINNTSSVQTGVAHSNPQKVKVTVTSGTNLGTGTKIIVNVFDLTEMFGSGNEPSTVDAFNAIVPSGLYEYNPGSILDFNPEALQTTGFNQWDEVWEIGSIVWTTGLNNDAVTNMYRSKNYVSVMPGTNYYFKKSGNTSGSNLRICYYDACRNVVSETGWIGINAVVSVPSGCYYLRFVSAYDTTYQNDICINFSNSSLNGTYKPYVDSKLSLKLSSATSTINGVSTVVAPYGLQSAGTIYDELICDSDGYARRLIKRVGTVDMGTLEFSKYSSTAMFNVSFTLGKLPSSDSQKANMLCGRYVTADANTVYYHSNVDKVIGYWSQNNGRIIVYDSSYSDAATFKTAMSGVYLNYELNNPIVYQLDNPIPVLYMMDYLGVERVLPEWGSEPKTSKMIANVNYYETTLDAKQVYGAGASSSDAESTSNKVNEIDSSSTDIQYPSAKAVYDAIFAVMDASY